MRPLPLILLLVSLSFSTFANYMTTYDRQGFIETYAALAAGEMERAGIPASITLAQAILESSWGQGKIAVEGNNFFGIKCYNGWEGQCVQAMDDEVNPSDFRFYNSVEESFKDHSEFLRTNSRYQPLFAIPLTDYRQWAYGLKQYGYATDVEYAEKLIRIIEENALFMYDIAMPAFRFDILSTGMQQIQPEPEVEQPGLDVPSLQSSDFNILSTEPEAQEPAGPVLSAPGYDLGKFRPQPNPAPEPAEEGAEPAGGEGKIKHLMPVPENRVKPR